VTRLLLVRHANHGLVGKALAGRSDSVGLDAVGLGQARTLAQRLSGWDIAAIYTSPQRRAQETAAPLARRAGLEARIEAALDEVDFGDWSGKSFQSLAGDPHWAVWCERRGIAQPPNGERFADVQARIVGAVDRLATVHVDETIALVSHGDVIKAALAHVLGMSLDDLERFDVAPASVNIIAASGSWRRVELLNATGVV